MRDGRDIHQASDTADQQEHIPPLPRISIQAFCETAEFAQMINEAIDDRRMSRTHIKAHMGGALAAVEAYRSAPTPNVVVIESMGERGELIQHLDALSEHCDSGTKVVVVGRVNDITLYRDLLGRGVSEYMVAPFSVLHFVRALSQLYTNAAAEPVGRLIAVTGAKGGVGASTIAHNLAWTISRALELPTVLADLDLPFGTVGLDFNQDPPQGIVDAVYAPDRLDSNLVDRLLSKCSEKLSILAAPATLERPYDLTETAFDALFDILRSTVPCVVLDVPHGWTAWSRRALCGADEVVLAASPDLANLRNTKNLLDVLRAARPNDSKPKLVLNGVGLMKRPEITAADFAKAVDTSISAVIPFDAKLFGTAANNGQMISEVESGNKINETFAELARSVTGRADVRKAKRTMFDPFLAKLIKKKAS